MMENIFEGIYFVIFQWLFFGQHVQKNASKNKTRSSPTAAVGNMTSTVRS